MTSSSATRIHKPQVDSNCSLPTADRSASFLYPIHTATPDTTRLSCLCRVRFGGVNWIPDNSGLSPTGKLKSEHVRLTLVTTQTGLFCCGFLLVQWRRQDLVLGGHEGRGAEGARVEAPKAPSGVGYEKGCPLPSRLKSLRERRELPHFQKWW